MEELHVVMDQQIDIRKHRLEHAALSKDTNRLWSLIAAAIEEANIIFHKLEGKQTANMRGRSKATNQTCDGGLLKEAGNYASNDAPTWIAKHRNAAVDHTVQGNSLIKVAREMRATARLCGGTAKVAVNTYQTTTMMEAYRKPAEDHGPTSADTDAGGLRHQAKRMRIMP